MLKSGLNTGPQDACGIARKLHLNRGHASPHQLKRLSVDVEGADELLSAVAWDAEGQCEVCHASGRAPHPQVAGATSVSALNGKVQPNRLFPHNAIALRAMVLH